MDSVAQSSLCVCYEMKLVYLYIKSTLKLVRVVLFNGMVSSCFDNDLTQWVYFTQ